MNLTKAPKTSKKAVFAPIFQGSVIRLCQLQTFLCNALSKCMLDLLQREGKNVSCPLDHGRYFKLQSPLTSTSRRSYHIQGGVRLGAIGYLSFLRNSFCLLISLAVYLPGTCRLLVLNIPRGKEKLCIQSGWIYRFLLFKLSLYRARCMSLKAIQSPELSLDLQALPFHLKIYLHIL